jgi:hypothetical protein
VLSQSDLIFFKRSKVLRTPKPFSKSLGGDTGPGINPNRLIYKQSIGSGLEGKTKAAQVSFILQNIAASWALSVRAANLEIPKNKKPNLDL